VIGKCLCSGSSLASPLDQLVELGREFIQVVGEQVPVDVVDEVTYECALDCRLARGRFS